MSNPNKFETSVCCSLGCFMVSLLTWTTWRRKLFGECQPVPNGYSLLTGLSSKKCDCGHRFRGCHCRCSDAVVLLVVVIVVLVFVAIILGFLVVLVSCYCCFCLRVENRTHEIPFFGLHHVHRCVSTRGSCPSSLPRYIPHTCSHLESVRVQSATEWTECRYILHTCSHLESIRVQSATEWTECRYILHTCSHLESIRVQSATEWTASVHTLHMPKPNVTRVQSATEWTASVHTSHMLAP